MDSKLKQAIALGREHYDKREYDKAEHYLAKVLEGEQGYADVHNMMGVIHHDRGRFDSARDAFRRALEINPNYTEASLNLAVTYNDLGEYELAQDVYRRAVRRNAQGADGVDRFAKGKIANLHAELAAAYLEVGLPNEAIQEFRNAIRLCPHFADIRVRLSQVYRQMGDYAAARYELCEAVRARPDYQAARVSLGILYLVSGQRSEAIKEWEAVLSQDPQNKSAQMYLRMALDPPVKSERPPSS